MGAPAADQWGERLPRKLGLWSAVAVLIGSTIGSGIFRTPASIAYHIDEVWSFALAWVAGGVVALAGALTFAELASMYPRSGGIYVYVREAFGRLPAFLFGWAELLILRPAAYGAIAITSSEYAWRVIGRDHAEALVRAGGVELSRAQVLAIAMIVVVGAVNRRGVEFGAVVQNLSTVLKVGALLVLIALGLCLVPGELPVHKVIERPELPAFVLGMIAILWAYDGWCDLGFVSGEIRDPQRTLPKVFILGTGAVVGLYLAVNFVYLRVVPLGQMVDSPLIAADVASALVGPVGVTLIAAAVVVSTFGTLNGSMMTGPRVFYAMAEDRLFFSALAKVHPRYGTPTGSILLSVALGVVFVSVRSFAELTEHFVIGIWPFYALSVAAVFVLRRTQAERARPYRTWGYPAVPLLFLAASLFLLISYAVQQPLVFAVDLAILLAGVPVYWWWSRRAAQPTDAGA